MKNLVLLFLSTSLSLLAHADRDCDQKCQHAKTLKIVHDKLFSFSFENGQDVSCPQAGSELISVSQTLEGSLLSAKSLLQQIDASTTAGALSLNQDSQKCGSCVQKNLVSSVSISQPKSPDFATTCQNRPTETFEKEFQTQEESASFVKAVLDGKNQEGQILRNLCPDPCSFYVYTGMTPLDSGSGSRVQLTVRCGQPRGSLFSKYLFSGALVHQWSCQK